MTARSAIVISRRDYGEVRQRAIGRIEGASFVVVFVERGDETRVISARRAREGVRPMAEARMTAGDIRKRGGGRVDWTRVRATTEADMARQALEDGEDPVSLPMEWWPTAVAVRDKLGLTQPALATLLGIPVGTWRNWEQNRVTPDPAARVLLRIMWHEPEAVRRALR